jgi:hypothetical protein
MDLRIVDIIYARRPPVRHRGARGDMVAHGIRIIPGYGGNDMMSIYPLNSAMGEGNVRIVIPYAHAHEVARTIDRMIAGPLEQLVLDIADTNHRIARLAHGWITSVQIQQG